ncbi:MAG: hypothetical protein R6W70_08085 [bacterium]
MFVSIFKIILIVFLFNTCSGTTGNEAKKSLHDSESSAHHDSDYDNPVDFFTESENDILNDEEVDYSENHEGDSLPEKREFPDMSGVWAQKHWYSSKAKVYTFDNASGWIRTYFIVFQQMKGSTIEIESKICHIKIANNTEMMNLLIPETYVEALRVQNKKAEIQMDGSGEIFFYQPVYWEVRSIDENAYSDPEKYTLPVSPEHSDVEDWDNDGEPGLRSLVKTTIVNGVIHTVQKISHELTGRVISKDRISGTVIWTDEQEVLKSDSDFIKNALQETTNIMDSSSENIWEQVRIPESADCDYIIKNKDKLFFPDPVEID